MNAEQSVSKNTEAQTINLLLDAFVGGATLKEIQNIPDSVMEGIYAHAYEFYQVGRFDDAEVFFRFLCLYDAYKVDYIMGLAATFQQKKQYEKAIETYESAFSLAKNDYRFKLHIGQCYLFLKNREKARESFAIILESTAPAALKAQAQAYLGTLKPVETAEKPENSKESHV